VAESSSIKPGVNPEFSEYLQRLDTSEYPSFDLGLGGRHLVELFRCVVVSKEAAKTGHLAVCNDVVWVSQVGDNNSSAIVMSPTSGGKIRYQDVQQEWDEPLLRVEFGGSSVVLEASSDKEKERWITVLGNSASFKATASLCGPRMLAPGKISKVDAAKLLDIPYPYDNEGAANLKKEYHKIPKVFSPVAFSLLPLSTQS